MADISMCTGEGCASKEKCYRFTAPVNSEWQCMMEFYKYYDNKKKRCENFIDNKKKRVKN